MDVNSECDLARQLGLKLRLRPGYHGGDRPAEIVFEEEKSVPAFLLGFSAACMPKLLRYAFGLDTPGFYDLDLVASHLREAAARVRARGLPCTVISLATADEVSVAEFRKSQADAVGVSLGAAKQIITEVGYGGSGADWKKNMDVTFRLLWQTFDPSFVHSARPSMPSLRGHSEQRSTSGLAHH